MVLLFNEPETTRNKIWRLTGEKNDLKQQIENSLGDLERFPLKRRLAQVETELAELKTELKKEEGNE